MSYLPVRTTQVQVLQVCLFLYIMSHLLTISKIYQELPLPSRLQYHLHPLEFFLSSLGFSLGCSNAPISVVI